MTIRKAEKQLSLLFRQTYTSQKEAFVILKKAYLIVKNIKRHRLPEEPFPNYFIYLIRFLPFRQAIEKRDYKLAVHELETICRYEFVGEPKICYNILDILQKAGVHQ